MLTTQFLLLVATAFVLAVQVKVAKRHGPTTVLITSAQAVFWLLAFVIRPLYMILMRPVDRDELADPRLVGNQYGQGLTDVLVLVLVGSVSFLVGLIILGVFRNVKTRAAWPPAYRWSEENRKAGVVSAVALWGLGWMGRAAVLAGVGGPLGQLRPMAVTGGVLLLVLLKRRRGYLLIGAVLAIEMLWAFTWESKAALAIPLLALCLRWVWWGDLQVLRRAIPFLGVGLLAGFFSVQGLRGIFTQEDAAALSGRSDNPLLPYVVGLLQRFDGISAVADAYFLGAGRWMSGEAYFSSVLANLVPNFGAGGGRSVGVAWTQDVRAPSVPGQFLEVPIAAGPTAEGYAMWGVGGVIVLNLALAALVVLLGRGLSSLSPLILTFSVAMVFTTGLFEVSLQGWAGMTNKASQATLVALLFVLLAKGWLRRSRSAQTERKVLAIRDRVIV